ncbi:hypothetical protein SO802_007655 [Lithocarpus litseifolius]|uniref:Uncharacterized protein n=1 Tax=Lithocarpus litseifolius TaxID=425828 RepID=A0AAW2DP83_9ROSI
MLFILRVSKHALSVEGLYWALAILRKFQPYILLFPREQSNRFPSDGENRSSSSQKPINIEETVGEKRVFSVTLGKFRSLLGVGCGRREIETSSCNFYARRCYSMDTFQYVVDDSDLQVAFSVGNSVGDGGSNVKHFNERGFLAKFSEDGDVEGKKISGHIKGESFFDKDGTLSTKINCIRREINDLDDEEIYWGQRDLLGTKSQSSLA